MVSHASLLGAETVHRQNECTVCHHHLYIHTFLLCETHNLKELNVNGATMLCSTKCIQKHKVSLIKRKL